jgi:hypothetical protein
MGFGGGRYLARFFYLGGWIKTHSRGIAKQDITRERCVQIKLKQEPIIIIKIKTKTTGKFSGFLCKCLSFCLAL